MIIDLLPVMISDGREIPVNAEIDFSDRKEAQVDFIKPALVEGRILNIGGQLEFSGNISVDVRFMCDRCGEWFEDSLKIEFSEILKKEMDKINEGDENPDIIFYEGSRLDISDIIYNNVYMNFPTKMLCKADCKGLCSHCGKNLNIEECSCKDEQTDPRFDILDNLFKE